MKREAKKALIQKHAAHKKDTGSAPVQVAVLSEKINQLTEHLKKHPKDDHSRRGLLMMVGKRRKLLNFLKKKDKAGYDALIQALELRY